MAALFLCCRATRAQNIVAWGYNADKQTNVPPNMTNVTAFAAGPFHSLALQADGTVRAWGRKWSGQTNPPTSATNVVAIAAGSLQSLAARSDGSVIAWGANSDGQTNVPPSATNVVAVAAGWAHCLALRFDGSLLAWGNNDYGQATAPFPALQATAIAAGYYHNLALRADGSVVSWGYQTLVPASATNVVAIAAGWGHSLALRSDGTVVGWGDNTYGQATVPSGATNIVAISAGWYHSIALRADGAILVWGATNLPVANIPAGLVNTVGIGAGEDFNLASVAAGPQILSQIVSSACANAKGVLVLNPNIQGSLPMSYQWLHNGTIIQNATNRSLFQSNINSANGGSYAIVVSNGFGLATNQVASVNVSTSPQTLSAVGVWGYDADHQCDMPPGIYNPVSVAAGAFHNLVLQGDGSVIAWGRNWFHQTNVPASATNVIAIAAGSDHSLALRNDGSVIAWGNNVSGQTNVPSSATNVVAVAAGYADSLALRSDGSVITWGNNDYGQVSGSFLASQVISIAAGYYHNLALRADGTVVSWGYQTIVPASATNVVAIAAGWGHSLALRADGTIVSWGDNTYGQSTVPPAATNIVAISAGWYHSVALRADGAIMVWGDTKLPVAMTNAPSGIANATAVEAGEDFNAVLVGTGPPTARQTVASLSVNQGGQLFFNASVQGVTPLTYQWMQNGVILTGQTNSHLFLANAGSANSGTYSLVASNQFGMTTNQMVTFNVLPNPRYYSAVGAWGMDLDFQCDIPPGIYNPVSVAAGAGHNLVLQGDGTVIAWGRRGPLLPYYYNGQYYFASVITNVPASATNVIAIAGGGTHSLALKSDGSVIAWGADGDGQTNVPPSATNVVAVAAGYAHSVVLCSNGSVIAWGNNDYGQTNPPQFLTVVIAIAAGYNHNLALRSDRSVVAWGSQYAVPASVTNVVAIAAGWEHSLALTGDGRVIAWGDNTFGQCSVPATVTHAIGIKAGFGHSMAQLSDGTVVAWGRNDDGITNVPVGLYNVASYSCGEDHEVAMVGYGLPQITLEPQTTVAHVGGNGLLKADLAGTYPIACQWFLNSSLVVGATNSWLILTNVQPTDAGTYSLVAGNGFGQVSSSPVAFSVDPSPYFMTPLPAQQNALAGSSLNLPISAAGALPLAYQWELNGGSLSDGGSISGSASDDLYFIPTALADSGALTLIATNNFGSYTGLVANISITPVIGWGDNSAGQLQVPSSVTSVVSLACGGDHNLALLADGTLVAWGDNSYNQNAVPASANHAVAIAEGDTHSLALKSDGTVVAWGGIAPSTLSNAVAIAAGTGFSQAVMPDGSITQWGVSTTLPATFTNVMLLSTKGTHSIALRADGTIVETGLGSVQIPASYTDVIEICAAWSDSLALQADGSLVAWGKNLYGQTNIPVAATNIVAIAAGDFHFVALRADGTVIAWGDTNFSQTQVPAITQSIGLIQAGSVHSLALLGQPFQRTATAGDSITFSAAQFAGRLATFQWQFNGVNINGSTNSSLTLGNVCWTNSGCYRAVIRNPLGSITSPKMSLSVPHGPLSFDLSSLSYLATSGEYKIRLTGSSGVYPVVIYATTNLTDWTPVFTNSPTTNNIDFMDVPLDGSPNHFYRATEEP